MNLFCATTSVSSNAFNNSLIFSSTAQIRYTEKVCKGCGQYSKIKQHYVVCNFCREALEKGWNCGIVE